MFDIVQGEEGRIAFSGRLDAAADPREFDFAALEYISSAGLGVLLRAHKKVMSSGGKLRLVKVNNHIFDIFRYSGFDQLFEVERLA